MNRLIIIGAGGHSHSVADIARLNGYEDIAILDDTGKTESLGYPVVGKVSEFEKFADSDFFIAVGNNKDRERLFLMIEEKGLSMATLIHPNAVIGSRVRVGAGSVIMAGVVVNPQSKIGKGAILNTCSSVDHDCTVGDFCHISVGAHTAGFVSVGDCTMLGIGAAVSDHITVCSECVIGAGSVVISDITEPGTYVGIPTRKTN